MLAAPSIPLNVFMGPQSSGSGCGGPVTRNEEQSGTAPPNIEEARRRIACVLAEGLDELDLGGLNLREIPEEVFALKDLKRLHLGRERQQGTSGSGLDPFFGEAHNSISTIDPRLFTVLTKLELLD